MPLVFTSAHAAEYSVLGVLYCLAPLRTIPASTAAPEVQNWNFGATRGLNTTRHLYHVKKRNLDRHEFKVQGSNFKGSPSPSSTDAMAERYAQDS
ncbi:hypothetical protein D9613_010334 [Agrocybe pediades]|uniref:Uncharacterized protein n=1 Tax=Agrocybe pediades TaxID=84607 RepID=A0A8H4QFZ5_9AGAR|nr:hypothetical protein D9613_010334 [Agrocybe pediades]